MPIQRISLVNRLGNKKAFAEKIYQYFPNHTTYIEPFFGAGGMFFQKPTAPYNFLNDLDDNITNLWCCLQYKKEELLAFLQNVPYSKGFWEYVKKTPPQNEIEKAVWFVVLSNWGYMGKPETLRFGITNQKQATFEKMLLAHQRISNGQNKYSHADFRKFLKSIALRDEKEICKAFCYADKPYTLTDNNYGEKSKTGAWNLEDDADLLEILLGMKIKFAISEYDGGGFEEMAQAAGLRKIRIRTGGSGLGKNRVEVIWVNYKIENQIFA